jgi:hypothetical protein
VEGRDTVLSAVQLWNAAPPREVTPSGMVMVPRELHPMNAP